MSHSLDELLDAMRSPDPSVRDGWAYAELAEGIVSGRLVGDHDAIRAHAMASLLSPDVQARTFAPLVLRWLVLAGDRDHDAFEAVAAWYLAEKDTRGHDDTLGWLHAVAHGADYLGTAAAAGIESSTRVMDLLARRATAPGTAWVDQENARVARAILQALTTGPDPCGAAAAFAASVARALAAFEEQMAGPHAPAWPPTWLSNLYATLTTLYVAVAERPLPDAPPATGPWATVLRHEIAVLTSRMTPWLLAPHPVS